MIRYLEQLPLITPELTLLVFAIIALLAGVYGSSKITNNYFSFVSILLMFVLFIAFTPYPSGETLLGGMLIIDDFSQFGKMLVLFSVLIIGYISYPWLVKEEGGKAFEYLVLTMLAAFGMMLLISANDLLALYVAIELMSLSLYVLASFNRDDLRSSEAGLKYFVLGALASGIMLYGISFIYGFTGSTSYEQLRYYFASISGESLGEINQVVLVGMVLIIIGFCFKVAAAPFHMWTPDVYEGAPTPVTAFFAVAPKIAAILAFSRLLFQPFDELFIYWQPLIIIAALASMLVGAFAALVQTNIKRLLAYSSIGHVGFILIALSTGLTTGIQAIIIYLTLYIFMSVGAFGCILMLRTTEGSLTEMKHLKGLASKHPLLAASLATFMFSMAGIPPLAGFFGKMYVILAAINTGLVWLAVAGVSISVVACFYYIKIIKLMYFDEAENEVSVESSLAIRAAVAMCVFVTLFYVIYPTPLVDHAQNAAQTLLP